MLLGDERVTKRVLIHANTRQMSTNIFFKNVQLSYLLIIIVDPEWPQFRLGRVWRPSRGGPDEFFAFSKKHSKKTSYRELPEIKPVIRYK